MSQETAVLQRWQALLTSEGRGVTYAGVPVVKAPTDFFTLQMLVFRARPALIIEIGNWYGGMLLAYAHWLDAMLMPAGVKVVGIDIDHSRVPASVRDHTRVRLWTGDAVEIGETLTPFESVPPRILIVDDSSHEYAHTLAVLRVYARLANSAGSHFVVEDTICGHGLDIGPWPGPYEAVETFLAESPEWERDETAEVFGLTWNPGGYLRRRA